MLSIEIKIAYKCIHFQSWTEFANIRNIIGHFSIGGAIDR